MGDRGKAGWGNLSGMHHEGDRMSWWLLQEETQANPLPMFQNSLPVLMLCVCAAPGLGLPRSARFVRCKRAKDHGRSEALCSQTARTQLASTCQWWVMDYLQPRAFTHQPPNKDLPSTFWSPVWSARLEGSNQIVMWLPLGSELLLCCLPFLQEPKFRLVKW